MRSVEERDYGTGDSHSCSMGYVEGVGSRFSVVTEVRNFQQYDVRKRLPTPSNCLGDDVRSAWKNIEARPLLVGPPRFRAHPLVRACPWRGYPGSISATSKHLESNVAEQAARPGAHSTVCAVDICNLSELASRLSRGILHGGEYRGSLRACSGCRNAFGRFL